MAGGCFEAAANDVQDRNLPSYHFCKNGVFEELCVGYEVKLC